jgi:putative transcriptional regulator
MVKCRIKEIRMKEYLMNIREFSNLTGFDEKIISSWEREASRPTLERALEFCSKIKKNVNEVWYLE